jgi:hypothetical protein
MIEFSANYLWLALAYVAGSGIGWHIGNKKRIEDIVESVIDDLIDQGYIKVDRKDSNNIQLLKHWENNDSDL